MRSVLVFVCTCIMLSVSMQAQIKGNPVFNARPQQPKVQRTGTKLNPELQKLFENTTAAKIARPPGDQSDVTNNALEKYLQVKGDRVVVDITVKESMIHTKAALQKLGVQITGAYGRIISGIIPVAILPQLEGINGIQYVHPAYKPMHQSIPRASLMQQCNTNLSNGNGPVISQGDTAQGSWLARKNYNLNGSGVKVGILSDSYNNLGTAGAGVLNGELPGPGNPFNFLKPVDVLEDLSGNGTDEGRAMAEIVHDVAPGAEIAFHTAYLGQADFAQGIQDLVNKGCKVITDDIFYYTEPFFQDGIIAQSVDLAKQKGVSYFSAAFNFHNNSYESVYRPTTDEVFGPGNGTAHNFSLPGASPRYYQPLFIQPGGSFIAAFQWDNPFFSAGGAGASSDLNIYLINQEGRIVAAGATDNIASGDPVEFFGYDNHTPNTTFFMVIVKKAGPDPSYLKYIMYRDGQFFETVPAIPGIFLRTLVGHAKAEGAITTAAAFYQSSPAYGVDTPQVERFSSLAGVPHFFDAAGNRIETVVRKKPDIVAPDGGNTSFFMPFANADIQEDADNYPNFFGTSAAAPHAAGVAALMIEAEKLNNLTPDQVKGILTSTTVDMDNLYTYGYDAGFDFNTGYGLIKADAAVAAVNFPSLYIKNLELQAICSENPDNSRYWKIINPNSFEVEAHWFLTGSKQQARIMAPPGETILSTNTIRQHNFQVPNIAVLKWEDNFSFTRFDIKNSNKTPCGNTSEKVISMETSRETIVRPQVAEVYPNPASGVFSVYLALADQQPVSMQLFGTDGKKLMEKRINQSAGIVPIDATDYKPGIYLLNIKQGTFNKTIKVIKQ